MCRENCSIESMIGSRNTKPHVLANGKSFVASSEGGRVSSWPKVMEGSVSNPPTGISSAPVQKMSNFLSRSLTGT